jgi:parallel beta-helix repeat protein
MKKTIQRLPLFLAAGFILLQSANILAKDLEVYKDKDKFIVREKYSGKVMYTASIASMALQIALNDLEKTGGSVLLASGDYVLDSPLKLYNDIRLRGSGKATRLIVGKKNKEGAGIICEKINGVEISGLTLTSGGNPDAKTGLILDYCGDVRVKNLFSLGFSEYGLWMKNHSFLCEISSCTFAGNKVANVFFDNLNWGTVGNFIPNLLSECTIYGGGKGIDCHYVIVLNIVACNIFQTNDIGIHIREMSNSILVNGCRTFQISSDAVVVERSHELNVTGNIFCWSTGSGIVVNDAAWGTISGNNVIDNGSYNPGGINFKSRFEDVNEEMPLENGIELHKVRGFSITGNTIFNWNLAPKMKYGILEDASCFKNVIQANNINYFLEEDVLSLGRGTIASNNVSLGNETFFEIGDVSGLRPTGDSFRPGTIQSYQPELLQKYIESLK